MQQVAEEARGWIRCRCLSWQRTWQQRERGLNFDGIGLPLCGVCAQRTVQTIAGQAQDFPPNEGFPPFDLGKYGLSMQLWFVNMNFCFVYRAYKPG